MAGQPFWQETEDWHTAGEPFRIVQKIESELLPAGLSVAERRIQIISTPDHPLDLLRRSLCHEPRGHADMYGGFITPPDDAGAHFGVLFWHRDGFSTACGHGTIALGYWAITNGIVKVSDDERSVDVVIDVPSGRVVARAFCQSGTVVHVDFINVASYLISKQVPVTIDVESKTSCVNVDLMFGGAVYACLDVKAIGLAVEPKNYQRFITLQRQIKSQMTDYRHQGKYDIYGVCFFEDVDSDEKAIRQKNVVVFADGQIDRSPCGSGTAARLAVLLAEGKVSSSRKLIHDSILDTTFEAEIDSLTSGGSSYPACIPRVRGTARLVGRMNFYIDPSDALYPGFLFR